MAKVVVIMKDGLIERVYSSDKDLEIEVLDLDYNEPKLTEADIENETKDLYLI